MKPFSEVDEGGQFHESLCQEEGSKHQIIAVDAGGKW